MDSADTVRDPRGFAVKFHTEEGNRDLVGNNSPIFFIRDPIHVRGTVYVCVWGGGGGGGWGANYFLYIETIFNC